MTDPSSFFVRESAGTFRPTVLTAGPWDPTLQHGGPPSALMTAAMESLGDDAGDYITTRVTTELLRPIPINRLDVEVTATRTGRKARWLEARLNCGGKEVARATSVQVRRATLELPAPVCAALPPLPSPDASEPFEFPFFRRDVGYHTAVEVRVAEGAWGQGPAAAWIRPRHPLVWAEPITPLQCVMVAADAANGVCPALLTGAWSFINPDLTVHLQRPVAGTGVTWVGLRARSTVDAAGTGLVDAQIHDERGAVGRALLSLVVRPLGH